MQAGKETLIIARSTVFCPHVLTKHLLECNEVNTLRVTLSGFRQLAPSCAANAASPLDSNCNRYNWNGSNCPRTHIRGLAQLVAQYNDERSQHAGKLLLDNSPHRLMRPLAEYIKPAMLASSLILLSSWICWSVEAVPSRL